MVLDIVENGEVVDDAKLVAGRVLLARSDVTAAMREEYMDALAETVKRYVALLKRPTTR
jgi:hypothetical protein